jgi:hypothetical protein
MWYAVFYVNGRLYGERPKPVAEVGVNEESASHRGEREVAAFGDSILVWSVGDGFFVRDADIMAIGSELAFGEFGGVVDAKESDVFSSEIFGNGTKLVEKFERLITGLHKVESYVTRITTDKKNKIFETAVARRKRTTNIAVNALNKVGSTMSSLLRKRKSFNVSSGTYSTRRKSGVIKINTFDSMAKPFNAYVPHQAM